LEVIGANSLGPPPLKAHLKLVRKLFSLGAKHVCLFLNSWLREVHIAFKKVF